MTQTRGDSHASPASPGSIPGAALLPLPVDAPPSAELLPAEVARVCAHYDIGSIRAVRPYRRGSRRSPKVILDTSAGTFLLKRRSTPADPALLQRVRFSHAVQGHLARRRFPLPHLVPTRDLGDTLLLRDTLLYEMFEFIEGDAYDASAQATEDAGRVLACFHRLLGAFPMDAVPAPPRPAGFHHPRALNAALRRLPRFLEVPDLCRELDEAYTHAFRRARRLGVGGWPLQVIHADWHPGNILFRRGRVRAVIDYDTVRLAPRVMDLANGALQFSLRCHPTDPAAWPPEVDEDRLVRFCRGYEGVPGCLLSTAELDALPWLMIEALLVEAVLPVAATGAFGTQPPLPFLRMIVGKVRWLARHAERLTALLAT